MSKILGFLKKNITEYFNIVGDNFTFFASVIADGVNWQNCGKKQLQEREKKHNK